MMTASARVDPALPARPARRRVPLSAFFVVAFAVSWLGALPVVLASHRGAESVPPALKALQLLMLFGAGLVALGAAWAEAGRAGAWALVRRLGIWRVHWGWWAGALLGPAALYAGALFAARSLALTSAPWPALDAAIAAFGGGFAAYLLLNTEELAWRGYALGRLEDRWGPPAASLILGVIWALFHAPLFLMKGGHPAGYPPLLYFAMLVGLSVVFSWVYNGTGGSVLLAHVLHQSFNAWADAIPIYPAAARSLAPTAVVAGVVIVLGGALIFRMRSAGRLSSGPTLSPSPGGSPGRSSTIPSGSSR